MGKIRNATANDDYTLSIEFEHGHKIVFNMRHLIRTMPYYSLNNLECFTNITLEEKAIRWPDVEKPGEPPMPVRLTVDNILFAIRGG
jgi:hypothetical protein